jgi:hypothetical protein
MRSILPGSVLEHLLDILLLEDRFHWKRDLV